MTSSMHLYLSQHAIKYLSYQSRWKEYCTEKNIVYDSPTVEQFLIFFTELFNQGVSHSVLISAKSALSTTSS